ncbi:NADH dehydrogenase subunit 6 [Iris pallida]|uniref:NADH dehydrogenase subunit 6 (Plastid) n=1 Tax=Iris pallida TaxID=29817 RepID=A0AAX6I643_IRIPA|nr:NADH dehydrogenase subunit 6 [Iris pallida]
MEKISHFNCRLSNTSEKCYEIYINRI